MTPAVLRYSSAMRRAVDTSVEARERQLEAYRAMTPEQRLWLAEDMTVSIRTLADSGARARRSFHAAAVAAAQRSPDG
jgi:hypothetical protein